MTPAWLLKPRYLPVEPPLRGEPGKRSRGVLLSVVAQFNLETAERYRPVHRLLSNGELASDSFCNVFLWDVTKALGCEVPHWVDRVTGRPAGVGAQGAVEYRANDVVGWLEAHGREYGWQLCTRGEASAAAERGEVAIVVWRNPNPEKPGHVALVVPAVSPGAVFIAQAGAHNFTSEPLERGFGDLPPTFYRHA